MIRRKCRVCPVIKPMRPRGRGFCSRQCWAVWREQNPEYVAKRLAGVQRAATVLRPSYVKRVRVELEQLTPPQETFTRREVLGILAKARSTWRTAGYRAAANKYAYRKRCVA